MRVERFRHFHHLDPIDGTRYRPSLALESNEVSASPVGGFIGFSV